jgi:hypothetical protein
MAKANDLTGQRFCRLTVIERSGSYVAPNGKQTHSLWLCACDCGNTTTVRGGMLKNGHTKSCGCLSSDTSRELNTTHGMCETKLYEVWCGIRQRCNNPNHKSYSYYGGRGISLCAEWQHDFQAFCDWAMANGYKEGLSIDRIDVNDRYCPENCRWATAKEQANNRRPRRIKSKT